MRFLTPGLLSISRITSLAELTYYLPRSDKPMKKSFASQAAFKEFLTGRELYHVNDRGERFDLISSIEEARVAMATPKTRLVLQPPDLINDMTSPT